ncbi:MAG: polysaccharide pyruvyl transferase CsaB [Clostridia bacterium]|nr:polysaccharide pyruvyl transferase CsaB [Clostridia bacterium]
MSKVVVAGYHGYENAGDDATLITIINNIRNIDNKTKIVVLSKNPKLTSKNYNVKSIYRFNPFLVCHHLLTSRDLILGGGTLLQDSTSKRSNNYYLALIRVAKLFMKKVMLYSNGLGPFSEKAKKTTSKVLNKVDMITLRENYAKDLLDEMKVTKPEIVITADPAFMLGSLLEEATKRKVLERENIPQDKKIIGVSVRNAKGEEKYIDVIANLCDYIIEKYDYNILFIPFQYPKDIKISADIINRMKNKAYVIEGKCSVKEIINLISNCYATICMRLHSVIFSALSNVPALGIEYDPKVGHYIELLKEEILGTNLDINLDTCKVKVDELFDNYVNKKENLLKCTNDLTNSAKETEILLKKILKK